MAFTKFYGTKNPAEPEQTEEPFYKYYDETPDGVRTEAQPDPEEDELLEGLQEAVREIKDDIGEISAEELEEVDEDEEPSLHMEEWEDAMDAKIERLDAEVKRLESITNKPGPMSEEDRQRIREYFLQSVEEGKFLYNGSQAISTPDFFHNRTISQATTKAGFHHRTTIKSKDSFNTGKAIP
ncbi:hypothetical protein SS1G_04443 [Sclerotinia sclerotiorum 1980 UF-70]|uniref:Uncharacterized protein n=1 Tax=Sclerotinia sclerotiorum (strain ATCC 18683 / 1980 / Ss-1) TaxID=665079 RepID=A7EGK2_SCLS1|nr:hypothetical protein SS1G_04443 [Sclerotinia sclerotiorum 1980 UF-70]EDO01968.1 hypothetical protein SS1G_04443 [Sclerotinia sclerotiorum 1980 UF-70]